MKKLLLLIILAGLFLNLSAVKKVAYVTLTKTMDATATTVENDPIIQLLKADANFEVTVKVVAATDVISDLANYDVIVVQEGFSSSAAILKSTGSLALANMPKPFIYNKTYALRNNLAVGTSTATAADVAQLSVTVVSGANNNDLFKACPIGSSNEIVLFNAGMTDTGATGTKSLNYVKGNTVTGSNGLLAQPTTISDATFAVNDVAAGTVIDNTTIPQRMIVMNMNFGAICGNNGKNITSAGLTIWRNAVYILAGLEVPNWVASVKEVDNNMRVVNTEYFNINGQLVREPVKGIYLKRITYENGATKLDKIVLTEDFAR